MKHYPSIKLTPPHSLLKNKVFWLSIFALIIIATTFWTQSRVPALNEKAQMGDRINISAIAFDVVLPVNESQPLYERTYKSSINWAYTNWKGMAFGFLLAATFITLLQILPRARSGKNRFLNSLFGLIMGSPLGICVNCATPVAQGMIHGGARLETSLSLLLSSPTLNPIVLTIAFSLLSFQIVIIKTLLSVFFILVIIPLLIKFYTQSESQQNNTSEIEKQTQQLFPENKKHLDDTPQQQSWLSAFNFTIIAILKNLLYIIKITLPLMILAGLSGSLLIQALPSGSLSELSMTPSNLFIMAAIGVFLPVPIAFDILIINILIMSGLDTGLAASLLFSLGIFSIYPALVIARTQSIKLSLYIIGSVMFFSIIAGISTSFIDNKINRQAKESIQQEFRKNHSKISFDEVFKTCKKFDSTITKRSCLQGFLSDSSFSDANNDICVLNDAENSGHTDGKAAINICQQIISFTSTKKSAISKQNINICEQLKPEGLIDDCKISFIRSKSLEYHSLNECQQIKNITRQRYCRSYVLADRMALKSPETCELKLSKDMHRQCIDNLNAHITSELGEITKCNELDTENAKAICRSTVSALKISSLQDYSVCSELTSKREIQHCNDLVVLQKSLHNNDATICSTLSSQALTEHCRITAAIHKTITEIEKNNLSAFNISPPPSTSTRYKPVSQQQNLTTTPPTLNWSEIYNDSKISVSYTEHLKRNTQNGTVFNKIPASQHGLKSVWKFDLTDFMEPFKYGKGIASGDYNNDGWPDLAFASSNGIELYTNTGPANTNGYFQHTASIKLKNKSLNAFIVAFIDIDNDGWQDLFVSAYAGDNIFFKNTRGQFSSDSIYRLKHGTSIVSLSAGFSDWDKDGDLDLVLGNWSYGAEGAFIPEKSQNIWYKNNAMEFTPFTPEEPLGETLSVLMSDLNNDNNMDMLIGNDRKYPDMLYYGNTQGSFGGSFDQITKQMNYLQETSLNTMSYDSADFNNDLLLDIFSTDMSVAAGNRRNYCKSLNTPSDKKRCKWLLQANKAVESLDVGWCASLKNSERSECYTAMAIKLAHRNRNNELCNKVSGYFSGKSQLCNNISRKIKNVTTHNEHRQLKQKESNKLLLNTKNGRFIDATDKMQVSNSHWSWTGKAADLDNDEWQDIYIGNGLGFGEHDKNIHSNVFFHNQKGEYFKQAEDEFGLTQYTNTSSYTYTDFDLDGDIDIISSGVMSSPSVFINQGTLGNSISFILRDNIANKFCIGCKIIIHYDNNQKSQIRELKLSGGFMSFDDPVIYFGLSAYKHINRLEVIWSDGNSSLLNKELSANRRYKISRYTN